MIRVFIVEDQTIVRQGLRSLLALAGDVEVVGEASDGIAALSLVPSLEIDVLLLDVRMPGLDGIGVLRKLGDVGRQPPTLVLTTFEDPDLVIDAIRAGARGFLLKDVGLEQLAAAIRALARGETLINPSITARAVEAIRASAGGGAGTQPERLTEREAEVLRLIASGFSNREIGDTLGLSEGTVKNHASRILAKLGVRDRTRAVLKAFENGFL